MKQEDIIRMAQACWPSDRRMWSVDADLPRLERFAALVEEALAQPAQKDAARYQHIKGMARAMSLDMGGNHYWHIGLREIRGPNLDEAIDRSIRARGQA
jgi:hypothetical protein